VKRKLVSAIGMSLALHLPPAASQFIDTDGNAIYGDHEPGAIYAKDASAEPATAPPAYEEITPATDAGASQDADDDADAEWAQAEPESEEPPMVEMSYDEAAESEEAQTSVVDSTATDEDDLFVETADTATIEASAESEPLDVIPVATATMPEEALPAERGSANRMMEEIIVTAQKREENIRDVAISVQGFSADFLDAKGITDPSNLPLITPGLTLGSQAGFSVTYLRGVGSEAFLTADPSIALYIDGVYFPFAHGMVQNFGAPERIEVLKGPQGTLFGRNAVGGAINILTQRPQFNKQETSIQVGYATFSDLQTQLSTNIPVSDNFAIGLSAFYNNGELPMSGTIAGEPLPEERTYGGRVRLRWAPTESLDMTLSAFKLRQSGLSTLFALNSDPSPLSRLLGVQPQTGYHGEVDDPSYSNVDNTVAYGDALWSGDALDIKLLGSYQDISTAGRYDLDGSPVAIASLEAARQMARVKSAEVQFISNSSSWGSDWFKWVVGGYYFDSVQGPADVDLRLLGLDLQHGNLLGIQLPPVLGQVLNGLTSLLPRLGNLVPTGAVHLAGQLHTESVAVYTQGTAHLTDWLALTLGGRYQTEKRAIVESSASLATFSGQSLPLFDFERKRTSSENFSPKATLEIRPFENTLVYVSYQEATKGGTYNVLNVYTPPKYVKPEKLTAYEVGIKTEFFGGSLRLNTAAFHYDIKDTQVQFISLLAGGAVAFENADARVRGIDFDAMVEVLPFWIDGLVLSVGGAWLDGVYTDYTSASGFSGASRLFTSNNDYTGNRVTRTPKFSGFADLSKITDTPWGPIEIATDVYHNSGFYYLAQNSSFGEEAAYTVAGARISYLYEPWNLRVTAFGKNLNNADYNLSRYIDDFGSLDAKAPPRTFGMRLNWTF
jgi:iron complex outermembrane receptor protein